MDKLRMRTENLADENFRKLSALFPSAVTETIDPQTGETVRAIDKDILMQAISCRVVDDRKERYQFSWPDKRKAVLAANAPINATLRPVRADSMGRNCTPGGFDSENLYIEGDNLDVLKLLQETYLGKVKMIYIDPPYNTGNNLIYVNDFWQDVDSFKPISGYYDSEGNRLVKNLPTNGRFHTDWLNMIYPRLILARNLLADDGIVVFTIDDGEIATVTMMMNEIFGENNRLATIAIKNNPSGRSTVTGAAIAHEYALFYGKSSEAILGRLPRNEKQIERYGESDEKGAFEWVNFRARYSTESPKMAYPIFVKKDGSGYRLPQMTWNEREKKYDLHESPNTGEIVELPIDESGRMRSWKWSLERIQANPSDISVRLNRSKEPAVYAKSRMKDEGMLPLTIWDDTKYSSTEYGANLLSRLMGANTLIIRSPCTL